MKAGVRDKQMILERMLDFDNDQIHVDPRATKLKLV